MGRIAGKLLILLALLLMPLGMGAAPAAAAPHHGAGAAMAMEHCPDEDGTAGKTDGVPECAMACSAALPAADLPQPQLHTITRAPEPGPLVSLLHGLHPEIATPPPKGS